MVCDKLKTSHGMTLNPSVMSLFEQLLFVTTGNSVSQLINISQHTKSMSAKAAFHKEILVKVMVETSSLSSSVNFHIK